MHTTKNTGRFAGGWLLGTAALVWILAGAALADTPALNRSYTVESFGGRVVLEMIPQDDIGESGRGHGIARDKATGSVLYKLDWYALKGKAIPLDDGVSLIRLGPWAQDKKSFTDLAVAFYKNGSELTRYSVAELLKDPRKIIPTASHYFWLDREYSLGLSPQQDRFTMILIDGSIIQFNPITGVKLESVDTSNIARARSRFMEGESLRKRNQIENARAKYRESLALWPNLFLERAISRQGKR